MWLVAEIDRRSERGGRPGKDIWHKPVHLVLMAACIGL